MPNKEKLLANAQKFLSKGQIAKAVGEYQKLVEAFPKDIRNRQKLAELLSRDKRNEDALMEYEVVAKHYTDTGFYLKAIAVYKQMQKLEPSRVDIYHRLAELNEKQGLVGNALSEYRNLISFYERNEMANEAIQVLEKMIELDPDNLNFRAKITECFMKSGRDQKGQEQLKSVLTQLQEKNEHTKIIKLYDCFLDICPEEPVARLPLASALLAGGQAEKAVQTLKGLLKKFPEDPDVMRLLADSYQAVGDFENARLTLQHLLKITPDDLDLRGLFVRVCMDCGEMTRARDSLEEAKDGFIQAGQGQILRAYYEELRQELPEDMVILETLTEIYEFVGESDRLVETDDDSVLHEATSDLEVQEMIGDEPSNDAGIELDLDLDLEFETEGKEPEVDTEVSEEIVAESVPAGETAADSVEIEVEIDFDGMDALEFDLEEDSSTLETGTSTEAAVEKENAAEETPIEEVVEHEEGLASGEEVLSEADFEFEVETGGGFFDAHEDEDHLLELADVELMEDLESIEEIEELEILNEEVDSVGESDSDVGDLEILEDLEVVEDLEVLDEVIDATVPDYGTDFATVLNVAAELEEAEFYLQQGLYDDAERVIRTLLEYRPELQELHTKLAEIDDKRQAAEMTEETVDFTDMISDLNDDELLGATDFLGKESSAEMTDDLNQELASELDLEDTEAHFDLGIAYKEMGLFDDAIAEFSKAEKNPRRLTDCLTFKGQCLMEKGVLDDAEAVLREGLSQEVLNDEARMTLNYELGLLYQMAGRKLEALECFQVVAEKDLFFRDVGDKLKGLRRELGLDDESDGDDGPQGNRDRVSYI